MKRKIVSHITQQLRNMSRLTPESKIRLASGHELPQLGFGVRLHCSLSILCTLQADERRCTKRELTSLTWASPFFQTSLSTSKKATDATARSPIAEAERCVREALDAGYRQIDSAAAYRNEAPCGAAIRSLASTIPRSEVFFTSKVRPKGNAPHPRDGISFPFESRPLFAR